MPTRQAYGLISLKLSLQMIITWVFLWGLCNTGPVFHQSSQSSQPTMESRDLMPDLSMPRCRGVDIEEATISQLQRWLEEGRFTSRDLTECYFERINQLNGYLRAVIDLNPDALAIAEQMDTERIHGHVRGPLHGIPFLVKDNIATKDKMQTTAGTSMLIGAEVPEDAKVVKLLRRAGAVLLGHANMSEWASMRATYYAEGYSSRGGQSRNPYNLSENAGGSSSGPGISVATNMCSFSIGTETDSSVVLPADRNGVVGIKPTPGLTSREGVIPESHHFDTVGTFGRTVADAVLVLDAISEPSSDLFAHISNKNILKGAKFGLPQKRIWEQAASDDSVKSQYTALRKVLDEMQKFGTEIVEVEIPSAAERFPVGGGWDWDYPSKIGHPEQSEFTVVKVDFYNDLKIYLSQLLTNPHNIRSLEDVIEYNIKYTEHEGGVPGTHPAWPSGQDSFDKSLLSKGIKNDTYESACNSIHEESGDEGIKPALHWQAEILDGLLVPIQADDGVATQIAAQAGYPMITIPVGVAENRVPFGLAIIQEAYYEEKLIKFGSALQDFIGGRPQPGFANLHAKNYLYVGTPPDDKKEADDGTD
ncbi:amidase [Whalleya microplaca]|nr:amidase [Whalleya microplaca]